MSCGMHFVNTTCGALLQLPAMLRDRLLPGLKHCSNMHALATKQRLPQRHDTSHIQPYLCCQRILPSHLPLP